jgi:hypothetical protein
MKIAIVPAQVTTVEDKVAGNLSLTQLILIALPVFVSGVVYAVLPPSFAIALYKIIVMILILMSFGVLAVRIKGILIFDWLQLLARYNQRPRYYIFNKNDSTIRLVFTKQDREIHAEKPKEATVVSPPVLVPTTAERIGFEQLMAEGKAKLTFKRNKKGSLHVTLSENN